MHTAVSLAIDTYYDRFLSTRFRLLLIRVVPAHATQIGERAVGRIRFRGGRLVRSNVVDEGVTTPSLTAELPSRPPASRLRREVWLG